MDASCIVPVPPEPPLPAVPPFPPAPPLALPAKPPLPPELDPAAPPAPPRPPLPPAPPASGRDASALASMEHPTPPSGHVQRPRVHFCIELHAVAQLPQCALSVWKLAQTGPHAVSGLVQFAMHVLVLQMSPAAHFMPHWPQLLGSAVTGVQTPPHVSIPTPHEQFPPTHVSPAGQPIPHPPQLAGSRETSTQAEPHKSDPAAHPQFPSRHVRGAGQGLSHAPQ
jgi:hypothetical protein